MNNKLFNTAKNIIKNSYSPYSNFKVSAAILSESGKIYSGVNIENASYPCSICAEGSAISNMVSSGEKRIKEILIMAIYEDIKNICTPCGLCRQRIREFAEDSLLIHLANTQAILKTVTLGDLLYMSFGPNNLNKK